jgi:hypothetical protein
MTSTEANWFPAAVKVPTLARPLTRHRVILARGGPEQGLWVYSQPDQLAFRSNVDWEKTRVPSERQARNGVDVHLLDEDGEPAGLAIVTVGGGCSCGALKRWAGPLWIGNVTVRT